MGKKLKTTLENLLSFSAGRFRLVANAPDRASRQAEISLFYAIIVQQLINSGEWTEIPPPEDQLPDEHMPRAFFDHWGLRRD